MADDCAQQFLDQALAAARRHEPALRPVKGCYNCGEGVAEFLLFCDLYCRDDYERRVRYAK